MPANGALKEPHVWANGAPIHPQMRVWGPPRTSACRQMAAANPRVQVVGVPFARICGSLGSPFAGMCVSLGLPRPLHHSSRHPEGQHGTYGHKKSYRHPSDPFFPNCSRHPSVIFFSRQPRPQGAMATINGKKDYPASHFSSWEFLKPTTGGGVKRKTQGAEGQALSALQTPV